MSEGSEPGRGVSEFEGRGVSEGEGSQRERVRDGRAGRAAGQGDEVGSGIERAGG